MDTPVMDSITRVYGRMGCDMDPVVEDSATSG